MWILAPTKERLCLPCKEGYRAHQEGRELPGACYRCYKVVVKLGSTQELYRVLKLQWKLGLTAKAGVDRRPYAPSRYAGYFYAHGRLCAEALMEFLRTLVPYELAIQRGCLEFELKEDKS